jgi:hypothetical protein
MTSEPKKSDDTNRVCSQHWKLKMFSNPVAEEHNFCGIVLFYFYKQLSPKSGNPLEKLIVVQLVNKSLFFM